MPISPDISKKLLEIKEDSGLTFKQIGDKVGSSEANVRRYIMGETKVPDKQLLYAIIRVMDADPEEVLGKKPPEAPAQPAKHPNSVDYAWYEKQEIRHKEHLAQWSEWHKEEIANLRAAYNESVRSRDTLIERIYKERDDAEEEVDELKKEVRRMRLTIVVISALFVASLILLYICSK